MAVELNQIISHGFLSAKKSTFWDQDLIRNAFGNSKKYFIITVSLINMAGRTEFVETQVSTFVPHSLLSCVDI